MAGMTEKMQKVWHLFEERQGNKPTTTRQAFEWAVCEGLLQVPEVDPFDVGAERMANAVRSETRKDAMGRRYRVNHAFRIKKGGIQHTFWGIMGFAPRDHMVRSFAWRRNLVIDDCFQLKTDVDVYNDMLDGKRMQIPLVLNFADDIAEREEIERMKNRRKDVA